MKSFIFTIIFILLYIFIFAGISNDVYDFFTSKSENVGFGFLKVSPDAINQSLVNTGTAGYNSISSFLINPAITSYTMNKGLSFSFMHSLCFLNNSFLHFNYPLKYGYIFGGFSFSQSDTMQLRGETPTEEPLGEFRFTSYTFSLGYSIFVSNGIYWGLNIRSITESSYMLYKTNFTTNTGFVFTFWNIPHLSMGISFLNIGFRYRYNDMSFDYIVPPFTIRGGIKYSFEFNNNLSTTLFADIIKINDSEYKLAFSNSFLLINTININFGYIYNDPSRSFSIGLGIKNNNFNIVYSFVPYKYNIGYDNTITAIYNF